MPTPPRLDAAPLSPDGRLDNPSFETGLAGWALQPTEGGSVETVPVAASPGQLGLRLRGDTATRPFGATSAPVAITAGHRYAMTFWARRSGKNPAITVRLNFSRSDGSPVPAKQSTPTDLHVRFGPWFGKYQLKATAPTGARFLTIRIEAAAGTDLAADFDDLSLTEAVDGPTAPATPEQIDAWLTAARHHRADSGTPPAVVLKLDDLQLHEGSVHPRWDRVVDYLAARKIKATIGIIGKFLEPDVPAFRRWILEHRQAGLLEFWHHGYDHREWKEDGRTLREFSGTSMSQQQKHLRDTNRLAREKLGFDFDVFGAPFNATDATTVAALQQEPEIRVWLYGDLENPASKVVLGRAYSADLEYPVLVPNFAHLLEGWAHNPGARYFVLQGHPLNWDDERFAEFTKIIDFMASQRARFVFATELAAQLSAPTATTGK